MSRVLLETLEISSDRKLYYSLMTGNSALALQLGFFRDTGEKNYGLLNRLVGHGRAMVGLCDACATLAAGFGLRKSGADLTELTASKS